ncbi:expressed protein [Arabidopsis lyrata subsp. lyrata]|uniref:Expressed protein n=1 Tax=Arabidopsis lyrata subsp. lyrata TaxID=81972 RepID=D7KR85_ARALL|nr:expressed protein [Arabidopsis lyrata subsp. lyrata]
MFVARPFLSTVRFLFSLMLANRKTWFYYHLMLFGPNSNFPFIKARSLYVYHLFK